MNRPKAQFQVDHGSGWETIAEVDIIDGVAQAPNAWTMVRALRKQIVYTGWTEETITVPPNPRDTHFAGFAKALWSELLANTRTFHSDYEESQQTTIARRAYDLVIHVLRHTIPASGSTIKKYQGLTIEEIANAIPDMTELPEE